MKNRHGREEDSPSPRVGGRRRRLNLRAAVEKLIAANAAARAAEKSSAPPSHRYVPRALFKLARPPRLTVTLRDRHLLEGELPIMELLDQALEVITRGRHQRGDHRLADWLLGVAIRAVCEAVVERGYLPLPLAVGLNTCLWKENGSSRVEQPRLPRTKISTRVPGKPLRLALKLDEPLAYAGEQPLAQVLDAALDVLANGHHQPGDWRNQRWFFRQCLRAVCEAILDEGDLPLPLSVSLHHRERSWRAPVRPKMRTLGLSPVPLWPPSATQLGFWPTDAP